VENENDPMIPVTLTPTVCTLCSECALPRGEVYRRLARSLFHSRSTPMY